MSRELTIVTPENIPITLELAGLGSRFAALAIDILIQSAVTLIGLFVYGSLIGALALTGTAYLIQAIFTILFFLVWFGYFLLFETIWNGQTVGKRMVGLRVVQDGGYPITFFAAATRNLIRVADFFPANYGVGALTAFLSPGYKRLGDMVAGTVVVKEREARFLRTLAVGRATGIIPLIGGLDGSLPPKQAKYTGPRLPDTAREPLDVISEEELILLRRFFRPALGYDPDDSERLAYRLVVPLVPRLNITFVPNVPPRYADLVSVIVGTADLTAAEREEMAGARF